MDTIRFNLRRDVINATPYLILPFGENVEEDSIALGMLRNNTIPGLVPCEFVRDFEESYLYYNLTGLIPAARSLQGRLMKEQLLALFDQVFDCIREARNYLIEEEQLLLHRDYLFTNSRTEKLEMMAIPIKNGFSSDVQTLFKSILVEVSYSGAEDAEYLTTLVNELNSPDFSEERFRELSEKLRKKETKPTGPVIVQRPKESVKEEPLIYFVDERKEHKSVKEKKNAAEKEEEDSITFLHLLTHFSRENWEKYFKEK